MEKIICPQCEKEGKKSKVRDGGSSSTMVYYVPYYDEDGEYHHHDSNSRNTNYSCHYGHTWSVTKEQRPCPNPNCDWGKD